ncbi:hypothetical protein [Methylotuvimicrobium sp. KM1]|uniref:hypothetical protein n=1 Tax=Methylotuvimicrobium sp. KM1 TaxID=3377707 RepID=UPI00384B7446
MRIILNTIAVTALLSLSLSSSVLADSKDKNQSFNARGASAAKHHKINTLPIKHGKNKKFNVQLGPRPYFLIEDMDDGKLKTALQQCSEGPFYKTDFSIGHRGRGTAISRAYQRIL